MVIGRNPRQYMGVDATKPPQIWKADRAPTSSDNNSQYRIGDIWIDEVADNSYELVGPGNWAALGGDGVFASDAQAMAKVADDVAITPANLASSGFLQWSDVSLTSTEIKALATTPIELVAAPAAGSAVLFLGASLKMVYGGSNVFTESGDNLGIKYTDASGVQVSGDIESTNFINASASTYTNAVPAADVIVAATGAEAQALVLDNLGSNFAGNAADDNTLEIRVYYVVQAL